MKIETKYNIGDTVWFMDGSKPISDTVTNWAIEGNHGGKVLEYYYMPKSFNSVPVDKLYSTKEQLIQAL